MSIHQLADATDVGYERARTAVTGDEPPGKRLLRDICRVLKLDLESMTEMLITEQIKRKHGRVPARLASGNPEIQQIEELWHLLLPEEKEHITWLVTRYAEKRPRKQEFDTPIQRIAPRPARTP
jgi:hypothetical protein